MLQKVGEVSFAWMNQGARIQSNYVSKFTAGYKIKSYLILYLCCSEVEKEQEVFH